MSPTTHKQPRPLAGVRVLDLTQFLSGPYCTQILADLGAEVIKLEGPQGDLAREIPPHFVGGDSVYYLGINRGKKSLALDLKNQAGQAIARRLALASDIVVENFRPGVLDKLGLDAAALRAQKPDLIWCSISGFGQDGPYRDKPAYDMIVQALSGGMSITGEPGRGAVRAGIPLGDIAAGLYGAIAVLAALSRRRTGGGGETIDISMLDCQVAMLSYQAAHHLHSGELPGRQGSGHDSIPTYRSFTARDGREVVVTANTERMWQGLCRALGLAALIEDPRFRTNHDRYEARLALWPLLEQPFLEHDAETWVTALEREGVPVAIVNTLDQVMADPQVNHRGMVMTLAADDGRQVQVAGDPVKLADSAPAAPSFPTMGQDNEAVLATVLGLAPDEIEQLSASGVIRKTARR